MSSTELSGSERPAEKGQDRVEGKAGCAGPGAGLSVLKPWERLEGSEKGCDPTGLG